MAVDKSLSQHYAIQGGGPNYLGKQKMVKAPKKWQSSPDHDPAELAYITKKEKDILIALDVHGSLKDGKPNRGPSGIISLQGDLGGYSGSSGGHDHGGSDGNDYQHEMSYSPPSPPSGPPGGGDSEMTYTAPAPAPIDEPSWTGEEDSSYTGVTPVTYDDSEDDDKAASYVNWDPEILGNVDSDDEYDIPDPTHEKLTQNEINEAIKDLKETGQYDTSLTETQKEQVNKEIATYRGDPIGTKYDLSDKASAQPVFNIKEKTTDFAKSQANKMVRNKVMKELGLAGINPFLTLGSFLLGKFAPSKKAALQSKIDAATKNLTKKIEPNILDEFGYKGNVYAKKPVEQRDSDNLAQAVSGKQDVVSKAVNQFRGTEVETYLANMVKNDLNRAVQFYAQMTPNIGKASQQEKDAYELLEFYLNQAARDRQKIMTASTGGRVDKVLTGRSRDI